MAFAVTAALLADDAYFLSIRLGDASPMKESGLCENPW